MVNMRVILPFILSIFVHVSVLFFSLNLIDFKFLFPENSKPIKVRIVGDDKGKLEDLIFLKQAAIKKKKISPRSLRQALEMPDFNQLKKIKQNNQTAKTQIIENTNQESILLKKSKPIESLKISNNTIKKYIKSTPNYTAPRKVLSAMDVANVQFDLQVPKGIKEDELNKHEMVFYSFRKRTALAYVNSFYKELNSFELRNPHLRFPLTNRKEQIAGKITYDKNGDILKIDTLKWTNIDQLQSFFMDVLKNMSTLPNPPKEIINKKDEFVINFVLTING